MLLHGDMILPFRLVAERRSKLKKWDVVTGRAAPNYGKLQPQPEPKPKP